MHRRFNLKDDAPPTAPEDDLPAGFSAFHQRFPAIISPHFRDIESEPTVETVPDPDLEQQIDDYLASLMRPRR